MAASKALDVVIRTPRDPNTLSNYNNWLTTHTSTTFDILFNEQKLSGNVIHKLKSITKAETNEVILDTSHLLIHSVKINGEKAKWEVASRVEPYGSPLKIELAEPVDLDATIDVSIDCETDCWLYGSAMAHSCSDLNKEIPLHVQPMPSYPCPFRLPLSGYTRCQSTFRLHHQLASTGHRFWYLGIFQTIVSICRRKV